MPVPPLPARLVPPLPTKPATSAARKSFKTSVEPHMVETAATALKSGLPLNLVAGLCGVHKRTFQKWLELGSDEACTDPVLTELAMRVEQARAEAAQQGIKLLQLHALTDWKPALELLRAQDPDTWAPQTRSKIDLTVGPKAPKDLSHLGDAELERLNEIETERAKLLGPGQ